MVQDGRRLDSGDQLIPEAGGVSCYDQVKMRQVRAGDLHVIFAIAARARQRGIKACAVHGQQAKFAQATYYGGSGLIVSYLPAADAKRHR